MCKKIHRGGNAEQYHADKKYKEAVAEAVEACADDTQGQTCYICTQALHWKTKEGLVRMCACRGTAGFAHVSCLAEQAKILVAEAEENNWDDDRFLPTWYRWENCSLCEQQYHGVVRGALGWACWKTYVGRPETDGHRVMAMGTLGNGLFSMNNHEDALTVQETRLSFMLRHGVEEESVLVTQCNLATSYQLVGRLEEALRMQRDVYLRTSKLYGEEHISTLRAANNCASSLMSSKRFEEAKLLTGKTTPVARRVLGEENPLTLKLRMLYVRAIYEDPGATLDDLREAVTTLEEIEPAARRVLGDAHPIVMSLEGSMRRSRAALAARETQPPATRRKY